MVDRKLAGAHYGLRDWAAQRINGSYHDYLCCCILPLPARNGGCGGLFAMAGILR